MNRLRLNCFSYSACKKRSHKWIQLNFLWPLNQPTQSLECVEMVSSRGLKQSPKEVTRWHFKQVITTSSYFLKPQDVFTFDPFLSMGTTLFLGQKTSNYFSSTNFFLFTKVLVWMGQVRRKYRLKCYGLKKGSNLHNLNCLPHQPSHPSIPPTVL